MAKIWRIYNEDYYKAFPTPAGSFVAPTMKYVAKSMLGQGLGQAQTSEKANNDEKANAVISNTVSKANSILLNPDTDQSAENNPKEQINPEEQENPAAQVTLTPAANKAVQESVKDEEAVTGQEAAPATRLVPTPVPATHLVPAPTPAPALPNTTLVAPSLPKQISNLQAVPLSSAKPITQHRLYPAAETNLSGAAPDTRAGRRLYPAGVEPESYKPAVDPNLARVKAKCFLLGEKQMLLCLRIGELFAKMS